jgi:beta-barrel assembly-enhancing protease
MSHADTKPRENTLRCSSLNLTELTRMRTSPAVKLGLVAFFLLSNCVGVSQTSSRNDAQNRDLILQLLERGDIGRAVDIAKLIAAPRILVGMRVDRRFAPVVQALPQHFDLSLASDAYILEKRKKVSENPMSLSDTISLAFSLSDALRFNDALQITSSAVERLASAPDKTSVYKDVGAQLNWLLDVHATTLRGLGRWDQATEVLSRAAELPENYRFNVSQVINLGLLYAKMGRIDEAQKMLGKLPPDVSRYGRMQIYLIKLIAAEQIDNGPGSQESFGYIEQHQDDSANTYQIALLETNRLEEAAAFLIARLRDPKRRFEALCEVQDYYEHYALAVRSPDRVRTRIQRWQLVLSRPEVKEEISKVGKVERFRMTGLI